MSDASEDFRLSAVDDPVELLDRAYSALTALLRRRDDSFLLDDLSMAVGEIIGSLPLEAPEAQLRQATLAAAAKCAALAASAKTRRKPREKLIPSARKQESLFKAAGEGDKKDIEYSLPPHLAHLLRHLEYDSPMPPPPQGDFRSFDALLPAAICARLDQVLMFFQKNNKHLRRPLPRPFLLSPVFARNLKSAVTRLVFPKLSAGRQMRLMASNIDHVGNTAESFWDKVNPGLARVMQMTWDSVWHELRTAPPDHPDRKELTRLLTPENPGDYDMPPIGAREIELFRSLLDPSRDPSVNLSAIWRNCHTLYEQERDPRVFQQQAREGALRDMVLKALNDFPEPWHDFFILQMHFVFPRISSRFLERFVYNLGQSEESRENRMPYLMRYIRQAKASTELRRLEHEDEEEWRAQGAALNAYLKGLPPGSVLPKGFDLNPDEL